MARDIWAKEWQYLMSLNLWRMASDRRILVMITNQPIPTVVSALGNTSFGALAVNVE